MANKEFEGSVEYTLTRTSEASEIVFNAVKPIAKVSLEKILLVGYLFSPSRSRLKRVFGAMYYPLYNKGTEKRQRNISHAII